MCRMGYREVGGNGWQPGNDVWVGGAGNDDLAGGAGQGTCEGGSGTDTATNCETVFGVP